MPQPTSIVRQRPKTPAPSSNGAPDDVLADIRDVAEVEQQFYKLLIYGRNRVGKTTLACGTRPKPPSTDWGGFPKPLLEVSFEPAQSGGLTSVRSVPGVKVKHIVCAGQVNCFGVRQKEPGSLVAKKLADALRNECPFKTIVLDTITSLQDVILTEILNLPKVPEQLNWGTVTEDQYRDRSSRLREAIRPFTNIPAHVLLLGQEKDHNPPEGRKEKGRSRLLGDIQDESFLGADVGNATFKWLIDNCDFLMQLLVDKEYKEVVHKAMKLTATSQAEDRVERQETGRMIRLLRMMFHTNYAAGIRSENPEAVPIFIQDPSFAKIDKVARGIRLTKEEGGIYELS